jgi:hypothetical protein
MRDILGDAPSHYNSYIHGELVMIHKRLVKEDPALIIESN